MKAVLYLEDGSMYIGDSVGASGETIAEVVFNTCLVGYQEILTDPSYNGQMIVMTHPLIGNYGTNDGDNESRQVWAQGFIMRELCDTPSNWQNTKSLQDYFKDNNTIAISGIDTRSITKKIRDNGSMLGILSTECFDEVQLKEKLKNSDLYSRHFVKEAAVKEAYTIGEGDTKVVVIDMGVKGSIIDELVKRNVEVTVMPYSATAKEILAKKPDGVLFSNGPGDPKDVPEAMQAAKDLFGAIPVCGICLGHQIIGRALGFDTYKLKFGHHGGNHPVKDLVKDRIFITSQNHNYALKEDENPNVFITHINLNDGTVEGIKHKSLPIASVQYHPEAAPGPEESRYIFDEFLSMMKK